MSPGRQLKGGKNVSSAGQSSPPDVRFNPRKVTKRTASVKGSSVQGNGVLLGQSADNRNISTSRRNNFFGNNNVYINSPSDHQADSAQNSTESLMRSIENAKSHKSHERQRRKAAEHNYSASVGNTAISNEEHSAPTDIMEMDELDPYESFSDPMTADLVRKLEDIGRRTDDAKASLERTCKKIGKNGEGGRSVLHIQHKLSLLKPLTETPRQFDFQILYYSPSDFPSKRTSQDKAYEEMIKKLRSILKLAFRDSADLGQCERLDPSAHWDRRGQLRFNLDLTKYLGVVSKVYNGITKFQDQFTDFCNRQLADLDTATALVNFETSQAASALLCQKLSRICDLHDSHHVYFNLRTEHREEVDEEKKNTACCEVVFHIAMERKDGRKDHLVWLEANFKTERTSSSPRVSNSVNGYLSLGSLQAHTDSQGSTTAASAASSLRLTEASHISGECILKAGPGAMFCVGNLPIDLDFEFRISRCTLHQHVCALRHPDRHIKDRVLQPPVLISEWISRGWLEKQVRARLARLIAELVLKFDATFWRQTRLQINQLWIVSPVAKHDYAIEPHISISITNNGTHESPHDAGPRSGGGVAAGRVFFDLGVTMLELAYRRVIPRPDLEDGMVNMDSQMAHGIKSMAKKSSLVKEMGKTYANVVWYCLDSGTERENIHETEPQKRLYKDVVRTLERAEVDQGNYVKLKNPGF